MKFVRPSVFNSQTDDSIPISQSLNQKRVHQETYKRFWDNRPLNFKKIFIFRNGKFISPFSRNFVPKSENCIYNWLVANL